MRKLCLIIMLLGLGITLFSCSTTPTPTPPGAEPEKAEEPDKPKKVKPISAMGYGLLNIDITNILGQSLPTRIELVSLSDGQGMAVDVPKGALEESAPVGDYRAYVYVYEREIPVLVDIQDIRVNQDSETFILVNLLEGSSDILLLRSFDFDGDLAIDRVELAAGTNPEDAASVPGKRLLPFDAQVFGGKQGWYSGELYAHSNYGSGTESVAQLIRRAERENLDFLAITDYNTMDSVYDAGYQSNKLVLIPAMSWGDKARGTSIIYGPRTLPDPPGTFWAAQAECIRVQAQGGVFAAAHPCFPHDPWLWGLSYVNAVQVWNRGWREVPPLAMEQLPKGYHEKDEKGMLKFALARAANASKKGSTSANAQAERFWGNELEMGLMASAIGGSGSGNPGIPLGRPLTHVYAREKSLPAIMEGLRLGRTYITRDMNGPRVDFVADVLADGKIDVGLGGVVPLGVVVEFEVRVSGAQGKKLQVIMNGEPILTKVIEGDGFVHRFKEFPKAYSVYRVRIVGSPPEGEQGFGPLEVYALTSPIYAQDITRELVLRHPELNLGDKWIKVTPDPREDVPIVDQLPEQDQPMQLRKMY